MGTKLFTGGDFVHARRRDLAITKGQAARLAGMTQAEWRDIERNDRRPSDEAVVRMAGVLRIDPILLRRRFG
jgi:transcriptional regulator with XRE-family HTH domain